MGKRPGSGKKKRPGSQDPALLRRLLRARDRMDAASDDGRAAAWGPVAEPAAALMNKERS
jgi:hypothetical protein